MGQRNHRYIVAVDGGGTSCRIAIAKHDGTLLEEFVGAGINFNSNPKAAIDTTIENLSTAARNAKITLKDLAHSVAHLGIAGVMNTQESDLIARQLPFVDCTVTNDQPTTVLGALGEQEGSVISIGTGSFAALKRSESVQYIGGWGIRLGDQSSGAWLGQAVLKHVLLAHDGLEQRSDLTDTVTRGFDADLNRLIAFGNSASPENFAAFAPQVVKAAELGDPVGVQLMQRGAAYIEAVLTNFRLAPNDVVCLVGGLGSKYESYLNSNFQERIRPAKGTALDGALQLARKTADKFGSTPSASAK